MGTDEDSRNVGIIESTTRDDTENQPVNLKIPDRDVLGSEGSRLCIRLRQAAGGAMSVFPSPCRPGHPLTQPSRTLSINMLTVLHSLHPFMRCRVS